MVKRPRVADIASRGTATSAISRLGAAARATNAAARLSGTDCSDDESFNVDSVAMVSTQDAEPVTPLSSNGAARLSSGASL